MTDDAGTPQPKRSAADPPAANQPDDEPIPTTPDESAQAGDTGGEDQPASTGAGHGAGDAEPADAEVARIDETHGVPVAGTYAVGSSGEGASAGGGIPVVAPSGKPDGEVDTRA